MTDQPDQVIPEVVPTEHIAPEMPPVAEIPETPPAEDQAPVVEATPQAEVVAPVLPKSARAHAPVLAGSAKILTKKPAKQEPYKLITAVSTFRSVIYTFAVAVIVATIFMWQSSPGFLPKPLQASLIPVYKTAEQNLIVPTNVPTPFWMKRIGVIAGHSGIATYGPTKGNVDPGSVCPDGFTEATVTMNVARQVVAILKGKGFDVDLLEEFDLKIDGYQAGAFISIHADGCTNYDDGFPHSGFAVAHSTERGDTLTSQENVFVECIRRNYGSITGLPWFPGQITDNMLLYHAFSPRQPHIAATTPGVIIELGLLYYDRDLLQNHTDKMAAGIVNGLLCFLQQNGVTTTNQTNLTTAPLPTSQTAVPVPTSTTINTTTSTTKP